MLVSAAAYDNQTQRGIWREPPLGGFGVWKEEYSSRGCITNRDEVIHGRGYFLRARVGAFSFLFFFCSCP